MTHWCVTRVFHIWCVFSRHTQVSLTYTCTCAHVHTGKKWKTFTYICDLLPELLHHSLFHGWQDNIVEVFVSARSLPELIQTCQILHSYTWHDSFVRVTWLIHMRHATRKKYTLKSTRSLSPCHWVVRPWSQKTRDVTLVWFKVRLHSYSPNALFGEFWIWRQRLEGLQLFLMGVQVVVGGIHVFMLHYDLQIAVPKSVRACSLGREGGNRWKFWIVCWQQLGE